MKIPYYSLCLISVMSISGVYLAATSETSLQMCFSDKASILDFKVSQLKLLREIKSPFKVL